MNQMTLQRQRRTAQKKKKNKEKTYKDAIIPGHNVICLKHKFFCKAKIYVKSSENATSNLKQALGAFMTTLLKVDTSMVIFKYMDKTCKSFISRPTQIHDTPSRMKESFHGRFRPRREARDIWIELTIGINTDPDIFLEDARCLLEDKAGKSDFFYKKDLQAESTAEVGFFLFSSQWQDKKRLNTSIQKRIESEYNFKPNFTLRWKKAFDPLKKGKSNPKEKNSNTTDIKALYLEVIQGEEDKMVKAVSKIYSSKNKTYLDGEKMRFILVPKYTQNTGLHQRYSDLLTRQMWFMQGIDRATSFELTNLDNKSSEMTMTAREMIMGMKNKYGKPIFVSVDKSWDNGTVVTFATIYATEARNRIADLGPFLHHKY